MLQEFLNIVHYCIYKLDYNLHAMFSKLNPIRLLWRIPSTRRKLEEKGRYYEDLDKLWTNRRYGMGIIVSGGVLTVLFSLIFIALLDICNSLLNFGLILSFEPFVLFFLLSFAVCYFMVFKDEKYLKYFKKYDKMPSSVKRNYALMSFIFATGVISLWLYSFQFIII